MRRILVRYTLKPEHVAENEQLVRAVYQELDRVRPDGFQYGTFKLDDGVTFVHLATNQGEDNPLQRIDAFRRFQEGILDRCDTPPVVSETNEIGAYRV
jgi:hypothetical protein